MKLRFLLFMLGFHVTWGQTPCPNNFTYQDGSYMLPPSNCEYFGSSRGCSDTGTLAASGEYQIFYKSYAMDRNYACDSATTNFNLWLANSVSSPTPHWLRLDLGSPKLVVGAITWNWRPNFNHSRYYEIWVGDDANFPGANVKCFQSASAMSTYERPYCGLQGRYVYYTRTDSSIAILELGEWWVYTAPLPDCPANTFYRNGECRNCSVCAAGFYMSSPCNSTYNTVCTACPTGYVCQGNTTLPVACKPGFYCPDGISEIICPENKFATVGSTVCTSCPSNSLSPMQGSPNVDTCICNTPYLGLLGDSGTEVNYAKGETNLARTCDGGSNPCPMALYAGFQNVTQQTGFVYALQTNVNLAPALDLNKATYARGLFNPDYGLMMQFNLQQVRKIGNIYLHVNNAHVYNIEFWAGHPVLKRCHLIEWPDWSYVSSFKITGCYGIETQFIWLYYPTKLREYFISELEVGEYKPNNKSCNICPASFYCPQENTSIQCPTNHTSNKGSADISRCYCSAGFYPTGELTCRKCEAGRRCPLPTVGLESGQVINSSLYKEILCSMGSFSLEGSISCTSCPANTYSDELGLGACKTCPLNSVGAAGSTSRSGCNCNSGYYRNVDLNCVICPAGYRCSGNVMTACDAGYSSVLGSSSCTICPRGTYSHQNGMSACLTCPAGLTVLEDSVSTLFHPIQDRPLYPSDSNKLYLQRKALPTSTTSVNITKWSFYATQSCTVTPVIVDHVGPPLGLSGYSDPQKIPVPNFAGGTTSCTSDHITYSYALFCVAPADNIMKSLNANYKIYSGFLTTNGTEYNVHNNDLISDPYGLWGDQWFTYPTNTEFTVVVDFGQVIKMGAFYYVHKSAALSVNAYYASDLSDIKFLVSKPRINYNYYLPITEYNGITARYLILHWKFTGVHQIVRFQMAPYSSGGSFVVSKVGTSRTVNGAGPYTYDFLEGKRVATKKYVSGGVDAYSNLQYLGWYFSGPACIPHTMGASNVGNEILDHVVSVHDFDSSNPNQTLAAAPVTAGNDLYSVSLQYSIGVVVQSTNAAGTTTPTDCKCGSALEKRPDGSCTGFCLNGQYSSGDACVWCPKGSKCSQNVMTPCATQTSSLAAWGECQPCPGPDTHSDVSHATCGLRTCPSTPLVNLGTTSWKGLGRITVGQGGNGVIPVTHWYSGYKCMGLVLNATADRPVSLIQQTLTVVPNQVYALRYKVVCTGLQCGANFKVTWVDTNTLFSENQFIQRSWMEGATPYFTPTTTSATIQFRGQMVTSSCTLWLAQVELVNLGRWTTNSMASLRLQMGVELPVRFSANYVEPRSLISMQITGSNYIQQQAGVVVGILYELQYWYNGNVQVQINNASDWITLTSMPSYETGVGFTQAVYQFVPQWTPILFRFVGPGQLTNPSFQIFSDRPTAPCRECVGNFWCTGSTLNRCPLNTVSNAGSMSQSECYCAPGYYGKVLLSNYSGFSPCSICPMNSYCNGGNHLEFCPPGTRSQPGSTLAGCVACAENEYCANGMVGVCPANSYSPTGSDDVADCGCMPGYYGTNGNCNQCESGYYCPGGADRVSCTANAISPLGSVSSSQCFCSRGYVGVNNSVCNPCQEGYWCWTGIRNLCPPNMWSPLYSSYQDNCTCVAGYTGDNGGPCVGCSAGFFKESRGPQTCTACPAGTSSTTLSATSASTCAPCSRGSYNMYKGQSVCALCEAGTASGDFGSTNCSNCVAGTWSGEGSATCTKCLAGTYSDQVRATDVSACQFCAAGAYSAAGSTQCQFCGMCAFWTWPMRITLQATETPAHFANVGSNTLTHLALRSSTMAIASDGSNLYDLNILTGATTAIQYDKRDTSPIVHMDTAQNRDSFYFVQNGVGLRYSLPTVQYMNWYGEANAMSITESTDGQYVWVTYPSFMMAYRKDTESVFQTVNYPIPTLTMAGACTHASYPKRVFVAGRVTAGVFGFRSYNSMTQTWTTILTDPASLNRCAFSPDGQFVFLTSQSSIFVYSMSDATWTRTFSGTVNGLVVSPDSNFVLMAQHMKTVLRQPIVILDPRNCGPGLYSLNGGLQSASECQTCPAGSLCSGGANITQCAAGSYSQITGQRIQAQCTTCPPGHYCTGGTAFQLCPLGSYSLASSVTRLQDCGRCPAGFYCPNTTVLVACPANTNSPLGSSDLGQCTCAAGYRCEVTKVVHAEVTLPISVVDFEALRQQYILAVAAAAGVLPSQVIIVSVTAVSGSGRRLLGVDGFAEVHTSIYNSKFEAKPHMALRTLQIELKTRGLPMHQQNIRVTLHHEVQSSTKGPMQL